MKRMDRSQLEKSFREYALSFAEKGVLSGPASMKVAHTFDVCEITDRILGAEPSFNERMKELAWLTGLFHDVSRFEQLRDYHTFRDDCSFDHGNRSAEILEKNFPELPVSPEERCMICDAIRSHNKLVIREDVPEKTLPLAKVIRDADKLSILKILHAHLTHPVADTKKEINLGLSDALDPSPEIIEKAMRGEPVLYSSMKNSGDFTVVLFAWSGDLHFPGAAEYLLKLKLYEKLRAHLDASDERLDLLLEVTNRRLRRLAQGVVL